MRTICERVKPRDFSVRFKSRTEIETSSSSVIPGIGHGDNGAWNLIQRHTRKKCKNELQHFQICDSAHDLIDVVIILQFTIIFWEYSLTIASSSLLFSWGILKLFYLKNETLEKMKKYKKYVRKIFHLWLVVSCLYYLHFWLFLSIPHTYTTTQGCIHFCKPWPKLLFESSLWTSLFSHFVENLCFFGLG